MRRRPERVCSNGAERRQARLSEFLRAVKNGEEVIVTERGTPVAKLAPLNSAERHAANLQKLIEAGLVRPPEGELPEGFWDQPALIRAARSPAQAASASAAWRFMRATIAFKPRSRVDSPTFCISRDTKSAGIARTAAGGFPFSA